ncbi:MAG: hypothetical protein ACKVPX_08995 [Myxococcaceae bacterium]
MKQTITVVSEGLVVHRTLLDSLGVGAEAAFEVHREGVRIVLEPQGGTSMQSLCALFAELADRNAEQMPRLID